MGHVRMIRVMSICLMEGVYLVVVDREDSEGIGGRIGMTRWEERCEGLMGVIETVVYRVSVGNLVSNQSI